MTNKLFRPIAFTGVAILVATLTLTASRIEARAADSTPPPPAPFWTELADPAHAPKAQTMPDFVDLAAKLSPAVVNISTDEADEPAEGVEPSPEDSPHSHGPMEEFGGTPHAKALGSGFIITKDGYVLTNEHVVDSPGKVTVTTQDGHNYIAKIIGHDEKSDIALLKIDAKHDLAVAPLGNSEDLKVGEWVMAIGNPFGFDHSVTAGIVSAKGRFIPGNYEDFIQTDASINPGNSGGPLIDLRGDVIGVNCAIYTHTGASMGIGFAVPIDLVKEELPQLRASGKVVRGWLGVYIQKVTPELAESLGLADSRGALVANVLPNGPAQAAGVKRGDVIVAFDNQPVDDSRELPLLMAASPGRGGGDGTGAGRAQPATGSSATIANSAAPTVVALSLARSALRSCGSERSAEFGSVNRLRCRHARARPAPIPARSEADRPAPVGWAALRLLTDVDISFSRNWCWQLRRWTLALGRPAPMLMAASPGRGGGDGTGAGRAQPATGTSATIANSAAPTVVALSLARSALRSCGSERSAEFGSVNRLRCRHARARPAPIPARSEADRPAPAGWAALRLLTDVDISFSRNWCWQLRRWTLALGRPAPMLTAASPDRAAAMVPAPVKRSELPGHRQRSQIPQHQQWWRSPSLAQRCGAAARKDQRNLAALTACAAVTRAREAAPIPARSDADRPAPAGSAALRLLADVDISFSRNCCWQIGGGRWSSGDRRRC